MPPILGALIGWFIPTIAGWAIKIPFIPFEGVLEWIAALESQWVSVIAAFIGVLAGVFFIFYAFSESLKITITDKERSEERRVGKKCRKIGTNEIYNIRDDNTDKNSLTHRVVE